MCVCVSHRTHTIGDVTTRRSVHQEHRSIYTTTPNVRTLGAPNVRTHSHTHTHTRYLFSRERRDARARIYLFARRAADKRWSVATRAPRAIFFYIYYVRTHGSYRIHDGVRAPCVCACARMREGGREGGMMTPRVRSDPIRSRARAPIDRAIRVSTLLDALFARDGDDETWVAWIDDDDGRWVMGRRRRECATVCVCVGFVCALRACVRA